MFYLTSKFHYNSVNTFGFMEGGGGELLKPPLPPSLPQAQELQKGPGGIGLDLKPYRGTSCLASLYIVNN